ncbi:unnamed protein product [Meloidogyne enterolobii]|uniref:Uncharacterized protein n=1 Tax=Meloidogyne enterolobii TaxID=390850 RepID=A0ACB1AC15_MELEN
MERKEGESKENNEDNDDEDMEEQKEEEEKQKDEEIKIEKQKNEEKALKQYYENLIDKLLFKAFTDKSPGAIDEFKKRIYEVSNSGSNVDSLPPPNSYRLNKDDSTNSSSLLTTNMPFYVDVFLGKELESRDILIKNILNKNFISKLSKKLSWKGKKGNEKILQIEKIGSFYSIKHEIIDEKINIKSVEELFKYNDWLLSGKTWPSKMTNLAISIDKKCENIGEIKGSGENALCIIVRLFAFCLAIDNQFRSNEGKLLKYFRNMDVLYVEWIRESTNSILNYFNFKEIEKVIETLIEEYNQFFEIVEENPYINVCFFKLIKKI